MGYRGAVLRRWSRRDRLAVVVVALTVAFVTGAGLLADATATRTTDVAAEFGSLAAAEGYGSVAAARADAVPGDVVLPLATATLPSGERVTVVAVPEQAVVDGAAGDPALPPRPPPGVATSGTLATPAERTLRGSTGATTVRLEPRGGASSLPPGWVVARPATVEALGPDGALVLSADGPVPLRGALAFFAAGARQLYGLLATVAAGAAVLVGVTVFGVTRVAVRDRRRTIRVARATGATPRAVTLLFAGRAALLSALGVALGYAVGTVATSAAVNAAVFLGHPTTLSPRLSLRLAAGLLLAFGGLVAVGAAGGFVAARSATRGFPAAVEEPAAGPRAGGPLSPRLLDWRAAVPTATTLAVFVAFAVVAASTYGVLAPLSGAGGATVAQPDAAHPINSRVPQSYAAALSADGRHASAEILAFAVDDGRPFVVRGADYPSFAAVSGASLLAGRRPRAPDEAVVGRDLARTLDVGVGDTLLVGGSTRTALARVRIVGRFAAREPLDDQLVASLTTARHLTGVPAGAVQFVRLDAAPAGPDGVAVVGLRAPSTVPANGSLAATVTLANPTDERATRAVRVAFDDRTTVRRVNLAPGATRAVTVTFDAGRPRTADLVVGERRRTVAVVDPAALRLQVPAEAPPGSSAVVRVRTAGGEPVTNATVRVGDRRYATGSDGTATVAFVAAGERRVVASAGDRSATATVTVARTATRRLRTTASVVPATPAPTTAPTLRVVLENPWNRSLARDLVVDGPGGRRELSVAVPPRATETVTVDLGRAPPGRHVVTVRADGATLARTTYRVGGDERLAAALATSGRASAWGGLGRGLRVLVGNLELLVGLLVGLAALMTVGATTAGFAAAVHARRRTLGVHRATGARPLALLRLVLADALRIGLVAVAAAVLLAGLALAALDAVGLLTVYGVRLLATVDPRVVVAAAAAALGLALAGAALATLGVVAARPARLLARGTPRKHGGERRG